MNINLYHSNKSEVLATKLSELVRNENNDIFKQETVIVPGQPMAHWLQLQITHYNGICANMDFPFLRGFLWDYFLLPLSNYPDGLDPQLAFTPLTLTWQILKILKRTDPEQAIPELKRYQSQTDGDIHVYQLARRLARLFDDYLIFRPEMIISWLQGQNPFQDHKESLWQMKIWQSLVSDSRTETFPQLVRHFETAIRAEEVKSLLPVLKDKNRIFVFGFSSLPPLFIDIIQMISRHIEVNLFFLNPCQEYWTDQYPDKVMLKTKEDLDIAGNPLLRSLGSQNREFLNILLEKTDFQDIALYPDPGESCSSLLEEIQTDIQYMDKPQGQRRIASKDRSIQFHVCYSPMREVEEVHQFLLQQFCYNPDLKPSDILVLVPDIDSYVPYIQAVFNTVSPNDPRYIKATIADRGLMSLFEEATAFLRLFDLLTGRMPASEIMDLLRFQSISKKFGLSDSDVETAIVLVKKAGIRWGIDGESRRYFSGTAFEQNSWDFGLKRLILGLAMNPMDQDGFGLFSPDNGPSILPEEEVEGDKARIAGQISHFAGLLFQASRLLKEPNQEYRPHDREIEDEDVLPQFSPLWWQSFLCWLLETFFEDNQDFGQGCQLIRQTINQLTTSLDSAGLGNEDRLSYELVSSFLEDNMAEQVHTGGFLQGGVTFCRLVPMRSIPAKLICLLGMNEGQFPRQSPRLSFDLMAKHPRAGDRDEKKEDRGVFLETILSARELLYISYVGRDIHTNQKLPPSPVVNELMDYLNRYFVLNNQHPKEYLPGDHLLTEHPLQPFSRKYFELDPDSGQKIHPHLTSYDPWDLALAQERQEQEDRPRQQELFFDDRARDILDHIPDEFRQPCLEDIYRFYKSPCQYLLNKRLNISFDPIQEKNQLLDQEPLELDNLEQFQVKTEILENCYLNASCSTTRLEEKFKVSGHLPVGLWGERTYKDLADDISSLGEQVRGNIDKKIDPIVVDIPFPGLGLNLKAELKNLCQIKGTGETVQIHVRPAKEKIRDIIWAWIFHLAANSQTTRQSAHLVPIRTIGWYTDKQATYLPPVNNENQESANQSDVLLERLLDIYLLGLRSPLPFCPKASSTYCSQAMGNSPDKAWSMAERDWAPGLYNHEAADEHTTYVFGDRLPENDQDKELFAKLALDVFQPLYSHRRESKQFGFEI